MSSYNSGQFGALTKHNTISSACGPQSDGVKGKKKARKTTSTHPQHLVLFNAGNQIKNFS